jgi:ATP-binding cassette subfamily E protein 1
LGPLLERSLPQLSGGELQRFSIAIASIQRASAYCFDEPSSYLDIGQGMRAGRVVRSLLDESDCVILVEHDIAILNCISDYISVLYGKPGAFGVIMFSFTVREGINHFLRGFIPTENVRIRKDELIFVIKDDTDIPVVEGEHCNFAYPGMSLQLGDFHIDVEPGRF